MTIDEKCRACDTCMIACSMVHENGNCSLDNARLSIKREIADRLASITICRHCKKPECMSDCPCNAMSRDKTGMVIISREECQGCGNCQDNCPFGAIVYIKDKNIYQKCDLCKGISGGPVCVQVCPVGALVINERIEK